jgi:hypothetical protein
VTCSLCSQRKARRACPALGRQICPTCCATKRLREIACPSDCTWLAAARAHPSASVLRQRERDTAFLISLLEGLSEPQMALLSAVQLQIRRYRPTALPALVDADVVQAASAMAATLETAARGILYEHQTPSLPAQRLLTVFRQLQAEIEARRPIPPRLLAAVFRKLETAGRDAGRHVGEGETAYLDLVDRLTAGAPRGAGPETMAGPSGEAGPAESDRPRIILP